MLGEQGNTHTAAHQALFRLVGEQVMEGINHLAAPPLHQLSVHRAQHQHHKFVAADSGHNVLGPEQPLDFPGSTAQRRVAEKMAVAVIDLLEIIQVAYHFNWYQAN